MQRLGRPAIAPARSLTSPPRRAALTSGHVPTAQAGPRVRLLTRLARTTAPACSRLLVTSPRAHVPDTRQRAQDARRLRSRPLRSGGPTRLTPDAAGPDCRSGLLTPTQPYQASLHSSPSDRRAPCASPLTGRPGRRTLHCPRSSSRRLLQGRAPNARPLTRIGPTPNADPPLDTSPSVGRAHAPGPRLGWQGRRLRERGLPLLPYRTPGHQAPLPRTPIVLVLA